MIEQCDEIFCRIPVAERARRRSSCAESSLVPNDAAEFVIEFGDIRLEHLAIHQKAMTEYDDRRPARPLFVVGKAYPFTFEMRHAFPSSSSDAVVTSAT